MFFTHKRIITIDAGTSHTRTGDGKNLLFNESTVIEIDEKNKVVGFGKNTKTRTANKLIYPVNKAIGDFHAFEMMIRGIIKNYHTVKTWKLTTNIIVFALPSSVTEVEKRAFRDSAEHAGAVEVYMADSAICVANSIGFLGKTKPYIIVDFGASKLDINGFHKGQKIHLESLDMGINQLKKLLTSEFDHLKEVDLDDIITSYRQSINSTEIDECIEGFVKILKATIHHFKKTFLDTKSRQIVPQFAFVTGGGAIYQQMILDALSPINCAIEFSKTPFTNVIDGLNMMADDLHHHKEFIQT